MKLFPNDFNAARVPLGSKMKKIRKGKIDCWIQNGGSEAYCLSAYLYKTFAMIVFASEYKPLSPTRNPEGETVLEAMKKQMDDLASGTLGVFDIFVNQVQVKNFASHEIPPVAESEEYHYLMESFKDRLPDALRGKEISFDKIIFRFPKDLDSIRKIEFYPEKTAHSTHWIQKEFAIPYGEQHTKIEYSLMKTGEKSFFIVTNLYETSFRMLLCEAARDHGKPIDLSEEELQAISQNVMIMSYLSPLRERNLKFGSVGQLNNPVSRQDSFGAYYISGSGDDITLDGLFENSAVIEGPFIGSGCDEYRLMLIYATDAFDNEHNAFFSYLID